MSTKQRGIPKPGRRIPVAGISIYQVCLYQYDAILIHLLLTYKQTSANLGRLVVLFAYKMMPNSVIFASGGPFGGASSGALAAEGGGLFGSFR